MNEGPRRPPDPEEERELNAAAYEATVPGRLEGFRGTNPFAFVIAGVLAIGIVLFALVAFLHRGAGPDNSHLAQLHTAAPNQAPAAPGLNGPVATPFIPESTPVPLQDQRVTPIPLLPIPTQSPEPQQQQLAPPPPVELANTTPAPVVPAPEQRRQEGSDTMAIPQPSGEVSGSPASATSDGGTHFVPVYRNGQLVSMVEVPNTPGAGASASPAPSAPPPSSQFVSNVANPAALGAPNAGLLEARKYQQENSNARNGYVRPLTARQLAAATVINARLMSKIESDLPGPVIAQVTQPVYDSATHSTIVIPAGSRVFGNYDEETTARSTRVLMAWRQLVFPDGEEFDLGGLPASDSIGSAGLAGDVDKHRGQLYTSALLLTVLGGAEAAITPQTNTLGTVSVAQQAQSAAGAQLDEVGTKIINQSLDGPATIIVRPPYAFQIIVTRDLPLEQYAAQHQ